MVQPLDLNQLKEKVAYLIEGVKVDAIAVSFLHSYANSEHEIEARDFIVGVYPEIPGSVGSEIAREYVSTKEPALQYWMDTLNRCLVDTRSTCRAGWNKTAFKVRSM
ncbi:MAG: hypothetical protein CM1200mP41_36850 [Gammaproteobacteria bacterium]|nr:MAG: hypothetical protein CM1200mP41_36850 [Gammaproteobacteria bacterium]